MIELNLVNKILKHFELEFSEMDLMQYKFEDSSFQCKSYTYYLIPFYRIYPHVLILVRHNQNNIVQGRLYVNPKPFKPFIESMLGEPTTLCFESFSIHDIVSNISDIVVDLFMDESHDTQHTILETISDTCAKLLEDFEDPRCKLFKEKYKDEMDFIKPVYTAFLEDYENYGEPPFCLSSLNKSRDAQKDYGLINLIQKIKFMYNGLIVEIDEDFKELLDEDLYDGYVVPLKGIMAKIDEDYIICEKSGTTTKMIPTVSNPKKFDTYLDDLITEVLKQYN
jgi:hypothetical protein